MTTTPLEIIIPPDEPVIIVRRVLKAPPTLVFQAWTDPEHMPHWWGPRRFDLVVCDIDLRVGGGYRFVQRAPDGQEFGFHGEYREIEPPHLLVSTFVYEGEPDQEAVETLTLAAVDDGTLVTETLRHATLAARDGHVAAGMEGGMAESYQRLDEWLSSLQTA